LPAAAPAAVTAVVKKSRRDVSIRTPLPFPL
jgi:hypothetical protein